MALFATLELNTLKLPLLNLDVTTVTPFSSPSVIAGASPGPSTAPGPAEAPRKYFSLEGTCRWTPAVRGLEGCRNWLWGNELHRDF